MNRKEWLRSLKFFLISISAGAIETGSFILFEEVIHWPHGLCYFLALVLSVLWNFTINRKYTFRSDANLTRSMLLVAAYYCVFTPVTTWLETYLTGIGWNEYIPFVMNMALNLVTEYLFQRFVVYGQLVDNKVEKS